MLYSLPSSFPFFSNTRCLPPHFHLPFPLAVLYYTRLSFVLLACLDSRVVTALAFGSWVRSFKSRLVKNISLAFRFYIILPSFLSVLVLSPIRVIAGHAGKIGARALGAKQKITKTTKGKKRLKRARVGS
uniref:Uncharacterized protein n=1 Tax=Rhipicephalus zambeziensis TaxID=60191 RepID=A0A224YKH9_9ACAR